jgi:hypothetical protein
LKAINNVELNNLHSSTDVIRVIKSRIIEMGMVCSTYGKKERSTQSFDGEA